MEDIGCEKCDDSLPSWLQSPSSPVPFEDNLPPYKLGNFVTDVTCRICDIEETNPETDKETNVDEDPDGTIAEIPPSPVIPSAKRSRSRKIRRKIFPSENMKQEKVRHDDQLENIEIRNHGEERK